MHDMRSTLLFVCVLGAWGCSARDAAPARDSLATRGVVISASPPPLGADTGVLFEVRVFEMEAPTLTPIAMLLGDSIVGVRQFEEESPNDPFVRRFLAPNTEYSMFVGGAPAGSARIVSAAWTGCSAYSANVVVTGATLPRTGALAGHLAGRSRTARRRPMSSAEQAAFDSLVLSVLQAHNVAPPAPRVSESPAGFSFTVGTGSAEVTVLVGSYNYDVPPADSSHTVSVSLVAERIAGAWAIRWQVFREASGSENAGGGPEPIDVLDIDGDGTVELFLADYGWESRWYEIMRRGPDGWTVKFGGGGDGC